MGTSECGGCVLPSDSYPDWLTFSSKGSSVIFEIPQVNGRNLKTIICHVHYSSPDNITSDGLKNLLVINHTKTTIQLYKRDALISFEDEEWNRVLSNIEPGNKVEVVVVFGSRLIVNKTIVYLIYKPMDEKMEHCHAPNKNVTVSSSDENVCAVRLISPQEYNKFGRGGSGRGGRSGQRGGYGGLNNVQCQVCNKFGHIAASCNHCFDPNFVSQSNFQYQNQFPRQHAAMQQYHFSYMHPTQVQPLHQAHQIPYTQHSQFQTVSSASMPPMSSPQAYITDSGLSQAQVQQSQNWLINSSASHHVTSEPSNPVQDEPIQGQEHVFPSNGQSLPIQYRFDPNYVARSNFQFQNQFPQQHAAVQPIFAPAQGGPLPHQQQYHFSYIHPTQVQPLQQAHQIPYTQHSQFQTVSSASEPPMRFPQAHITNLGISQAPTQQSQNWFTNSSASYHVTSDPTNLVQAEPVQGHENVFLDNSQG